MKPKASSPTEYVVLMEIDNNWRLYDRAVASSALAAVRAVVTAPSNASKYGTFLAVPARSWQPIEVRKVVKERLEVRIAPPAPVPVPVEPDE